MCILAPRGILLSIPSDQGENSLSNPIIRARFVFLVKQDPALIVEEFIDLFEREAAETELVPELRHNFVEYGILP